VIHYASPRRLFRLGLPPQVLSTPQGAFLAQIISRVDVAVKTDVAIKNLFPLVYRAKRWYNLLQRKARARQQCHLPASPIRFPAISRKHGYTYCTTQPPFLQVGRRAAFCLYLNLAQTTRVQCDHKGVQPLNNPPILLVTPDTERGKRAFSHDTRLEQPTCHH